MRTNWDQNLFIKANCSVNETLIKPMHSKARLQSHPPFYFPLHLLVILIFPASS